MKKYATHCDNTNCRRHDNSESGCERYSIHTVDLCPIFKLDGVLAECESCCAQVPFNDTLPHFGRRLCPDCMKKAAKGMGYK